jgi:hypothetical protein
MISKSVQLPREAVAVFASDESGLKTSVAPPDTSFGSIPKTEPVGAF